MIGGGWLKLKPGQVTDDTELALCVGRAIIASGGFDLKLVCDEFAAWLKRIPVDVGNTTRRGLRRYIVDGSMESPPNEGDAGNNACVRNLPVTLATLDCDPSFQEWTIAQSHVTHNNAAVGRGCPWGRAGCCAAWSSAVASWRRARRRRRCWRLIPSSASTASAGRAPPTSSIPCAPCSRSTS